MNGEASLTDPTLIEQLPSRQLLRELFQLFFGREPDLSGGAAYLQELESGDITARQLIEWFIHSAEWSHVTPMTEFGPSLHYGRGVFIRSLPRARRILDLGGASIGDPSGALVLMGYPYDFEELVVVDLPTEERHELYREEARPQRVNTKRGPVRYEYHSMADLTRYPSRSFDLVYSGQSIEHITLRDAQSMLDQAHRVLRPGGYLVVDTPNARLTRIQQSAYIDPDHKFEYTNRQLSTLLRSRGFAIKRATGVSYGGHSVETGVFDPIEMATNRGLYDAIEDCYLLAYVCRRSTTLAPQSILARLRWHLFGPSAIPTRAWRHAQRRLARLRSG